jgi:hypothetical protein
MEIEKRFFIFFDSNHDSRSFPVILGQPAVFYYVWGLV